MSDATATIVETRPTLSVIIPNFNHAHFLPACLDSVLNQSWQPEEVIVIDDASTDNSVEVIEGFMRKYPLVRLHRNPENRGILYNINLARELAHGDYLYHPAADDTVMPGFFETSMQLLARHPQAALSCTVGIWTEESSGYQWQMGLGNGSEPCYLTPDQMFELERNGRLYIAAHTVIFRRVCLAEAGGFIPELKWYTDWFAAYVAGFRHGVCFVPEPLARFNILPASYYTRSRAEPRGNREVLEHLLELLNRPEYREPSDRIARSGAMYQLGPGLLGVIRSRSEYGRFWTTPLLRKYLWHRFRLFGKRLLPKWVGRLYLMAFYKN